MTFRTIINLETGEEQQIPLTPEEIAALDAARPTYTPPSPVLCCIATLDFDVFEIDGVANGAGMSMAFMVGEGVMWVFFETPMTNTSYGWNVTSSSGKANVTDRQLDYIEITVTDEAGAAVPTASVSLQIFKVN